MSGSEQFWASGTWLFLIHGFAVLVVAVIRSSRMERRYRRVNDQSVTPSPDIRGGER